MEAGCSKSNPSLCTLPFECKQAIISFLPDFDSLRAMILSHSSFYAAFHDRKKFFIQQVLTNLIPPALLPDAFFALDASLIEPWTREKVKDIWNRYRNNEPPPSSPWELRNALAIQAFYRHVSFFTDDFLSVALTKAPFQSYSSLLHPSPSEWQRVARSFYRFEIFHHLFKKRDRRHRENKESPDFETEEQWELYFQYHAVWEIEQLACVSEYLYRGLCIPFNDVAAHDLEWAYFEVEYGDNEAWESVCQFHKKTHFTRGLSFLRKVITTQSYEERYQLLNWRPKLTTGFILNTLDHLNSYYDDDEHSDENQDTIQFSNAEINPAIMEGRSLHTHPFGDYSSEKLPNWLRVPLIKDSDAGAMKVWRWAHRNSTTPEVFYNLEARELRRWGYVMWDHARLNQGGIFDTPFQRPGEVDWEEIDWRENSIHVSISMRKELYKKGARGWWDKLDESKLVWTDLRICDDL